MSMAQAESGLDPALPDLQRKLEELLRLLGLTTRLPSVPRFASVGEIKQFCGGLLDPTCPHPWREGLRVFPPRQAASVKHTLFLFRKILPAVEDPFLKAKAYVRGMSRPSPATDPGFLAFCQREIPKLFRPGWDRSYASKVSGLTLSTSGCLENSRSDGGARAVGSADYCQSVARGLIVPPLPQPVRVTAIEDGGKYRVVSCGSWRESFLSPLHNTIYDHLSKFDWLLRGDARPRSFRGFTSVPGEVYFSGDYEAATDNLSLEVYQELLRLVSLTSREVPDSVWSAALLYSQRDLYVPKDRGLHRQRRGQLMGSFLSFPFLCLVNYLCFRWVVGDGPPVAVNGDDIVFRATPSLGEEWMGKVAAAGLTLSKGKTLVDHQVFTLNSSLFWGGRSRVEALPFIRSKALFLRPYSVSAFVGQFRALCPGFSGERRRPVYCSFLSRCRGVIFGSRRSLTRCLGLKVPTSVLRMTGLYKREVHYLSFKEERELPPVCPVLSFKCLPSGWTRLPLARFNRSKRKRLRTDERTSFFPAVLAKSRVTSPVVSFKDYWVAVRDGCWGYQPINLPPGVHAYWLRLCVKLGARTVNPVPKPLPVLSKVWVRKECLAPSRNPGLGYDPG